MGRVSRIWPAWSTTVGAMLDASIAVRFACGRCKRVFDVDLVAVAHVRGRASSLIDVLPRCKVSRCRGAGYFLATDDPDRPLIVLASVSHLPSWLIGIRLSDHDAPPEPPPTSPAPMGIDQRAWEKADVRERRRLVRVARG